MDFDKLIEQLKSKSQLIHTLAFECQMNSKIIIIINLLDFKHCIAVFYYETISFKY